VLIAQAVFFQSADTHADGTQSRRQLTDALYPTPRLPPASVVSMGYLYNNRMLIFIFIAYKNVNSSKNTFNHTIT